MIYLTGSTNDADEPALIAGGIGLMVQPGNGYYLRADRYPVYAADNGCFAGAWHEETHLDWLDRLPREACLFAVAPDVYPDARASLDLGARYFGLIREMGFPVAVVAQDGAEHLEYPWDDFDVLFVGGARTANPDDEWKISVAAERVCHEARRHGKWVHMGRVSSLKRMKRARSMGCLSVDGTFVKYRRRRRVADVTADARDSRGANELGAWGDWLYANPTLPLAPLETPAHPAHRRALGLVSR